MQLTLTPGNLGRPADHAFKDRPYQTSLHLNLSDHAHRVDFKAHEAARSYAPRMARSYSLIDVHFTPFPDAPFPSDWTEVDFHVVYFDTPSEGNYSLDRPY